ncbi:MAG TPA: hypothetical protein VFP09_07880, partial [Desertimonas sp.]|nr:hypothetical protein [Desertimonas sp.]
LALDAAPTGGAAIDAWPVGSIFIGVTPTNPATLLGGGTWAVFGTGRMLVGVDAGDAQMDTAEKIGGSKTTVLVTANLPSHAHTMAHTHPIDHNHPVATSGTESADHVHSIAHNHATATSSSIGAHSHTGWFKVNFGGGGSGYVGVREVDSTNAVNNTAPSNAHSHTVDLASFSGNSAGRSATHTHTVDVPAFVGPSGASSAANTGTAGTATAFSNLDPFIAVHMWKRTA